MTEEVSIRPYAEGDMWVLERTLGDPNQMVHLNGPESPETLRKRHKLFLALSADPSAGCMYTITMGPENAPVGNVGYWERDEDGQNGWEAGWFVLPEFQGKGIATAATRLLANHVAKLNRRFLFASPSVNNHQSNAICRKLGFALAGETESEYPPESGKFLRVNIWRLDLKALGATD
ncbi:MAG: GNAT family N-acetyltransferase [Nitrososphaerota archaeon]|nr:GNAT family N-acetyltransferase [Nitrososphaerota archaeon]MDG7024941.1 GNAT family N-acetyltransferase [Nitrososphaerota archaeon]